MVLKNNIIVFASGILGHKMLEYLYQIIKIELIATDSNSDCIITFAKQNGLDIFIGKPNKDELVLKLQNKRSNILLSINYLFLALSFNPNFIMAAVNSHPFCSSNAFNILSCTSLSLSKVCKFLYLPSKSLVHF